MFSKKIKKVIFFLAVLFFVTDYSAASVKNVVTEEMLSYDVKTAKTKNKKEKALKNLFYYYVDNKRYDDIIEISDSLLEYKLTKKEKYNLYYNLTTAYRSKKKFEAAIEAAQEAEYLYPKKIDIKMLMGKIYTDNSLYELAANKFKSVLELDDEHVSALTNLGNVYKLQENYKQALKYYEKAMSIRKNLLVEVYVNMAVSYKEIGNRDEAINILKNLKEQNKESSLLLADIYKTKKDFAKAREALSPYVYQKDVDLEICCKQAELCLFSKDYHEAKNILLFYKDKTKKKNVEVIDFLLAEAYYMAGDKKEAIKILNNILKYTKSEYFKDTAKKVMTFEKVNK